MLEDGKKLASLPKLQEASDALDSVKANLGLAAQGGDIPNIVKQLMVDNEGYKNDMEATTLTLRARNDEIARL